MGKPNKPAAEAVKTVPTTAPKTEPETIPDAPVEAAGEQKTDVEAENSGEMTSPAAPETRVDGSHSEVDDQLIKTGFRKIRVAEFRGSYRDAHFDDDGEAELSDTTYDAFRSEFPGAVVEEL